MLKRVLIAGFKHETNTFSRLPTDLAAYRDRALFYGRGVIDRRAGTQSEIAAFVDAGKSHGWEIVPAIYADATPSGKVTREAFEHVSSVLLDCIDGRGPFDALLLCLHGAMVTEHEDDGEGALLALVRARVGTGVPIGVTLDLHANVTDQMASLADVMVSYRTYPHVDAYEVGAEAAGLVARTLKGEIRPRVVVARGAMLDGADHGRTTAPGPMTEALSLAQKFHADPAILAVSINAGFPWADTRDTGPSVVVVGDGDGPRPTEVASQLIGYLYENRHRRSIRTVSVTEAMASVRSAPGGQGPIVVADFADNPGGGGYGDATGLLAGMLQAKLDNAAFATVYDPEAAAACARAGEGAGVSLSLGGQVDPATGAPLEISGTVTRLTDGRLTYDGPMSRGVSVEMGPTAVLKVNGLEIIVTSRRFQVYDQQFFKHAGIDPAQKSVLAVKSAHHFRAAFGPIACEVLLVDEGGGITSRNFEKLPYEKVRRPVWPLD